MVRWQTRECNRLQSGIRSGQYRHGPPIFMIEDNEKFGLELMLAILMWKEGIFSKAFIEWVELGEKYSGSFLKLEFPEES
jgi:hypothetical protein